MSRASTLLLTVALAVTACSRGGGSATSAAGSVVDNGDPPGRAARLSAVEGDVSLETPGSETWSKASPNYTVTTGDRLYTGPKARAELDLGNAALRLDQGADVTVTNLTDHFTQVGLNNGALDASLYRYDPADSIEVDTPNGALVPNGAGTYLVSVDPNNGVTTVNVETGTIELTGPGVDQTLVAGQVVRLVGTNPIQVLSVTQPEPLFSDLDRWRAARDVRWQPNGATARYVAPSIPGWEDLDENGDWTVDLANAPVWCPSHVSTNWVPYRDGRWSWVEPWGWTWVDDEPWGYAPFHYGRWETLSANPSCHSHWGWVPGPVADEPVYAPALVSFVDGAALGASLGPTVQGWFPLGPREPYFPWYHHSDRYLRAVNVTNLREVADVDPIIRNPDVGAIRWVNRSSALTAVPATAFRAGQPLGRDVIRLRPQQIEMAQVAPHPSVNPDLRLYAGGPPAPRPPIAVRPEMVVTHAAPGVAQNPGSRREVPRAVAIEGKRGGVHEPPPTVAPLITRNTPPPPEQRRHEQAQAAGEVARPMPVERGLRVAPAPPGRVEPALPAGRGVPVAPVAPPTTVRPIAPRPIITRNPPPAVRPPVAAQQPAMQEHPGRPLEPRQIENIRAGRPAGPPRDVEIPSHPAPVARPAAPPAPPAASAPPAAAPRPGPAPRSGGPPPNGKRGRGPGPDHE